MGRLIFVHGTGVREKSYEASFAQLEERLETIKKQNKVLSSWNLVKCLWGEEVGVKMHLSGKSLPKYHGEASQQPPDEIMDWWLLYQDPELELRVWGATEKPLPPAPPNVTPKWQPYHQKISGFVPSQTLVEKLSEARLQEFWQPAQVEHEDPKSAYSRAIRTVAKPEDYNTLARIYARAMVARITILGQSAGLAAPTAELRDAIVQQIVDGLTVGLMGFRDWRAKAANKVSSIWHNTVELTKANFGLALAYTGIVSRDKLSDETYQASGDILFYQARGERLRNCIKKVVEADNTPVILLAHSLGGIACVDMLIEQQFPLVKGLITVGSQAPMLYEINSLVKLEAGQPLPGYFPPWLNFYDLCDVLSYPARGVFPGKAQDKMLDSGLPYLQAHSAYWKEPEVWTAITKFMLKVQD